MLPAPLWYPRKSFLSFQFALFNLSNAATLMLLMPVFAFYFLSFFPFASVLSVPPLLKSYCIFQNAKNLLSWKNEWRTSVNFYYFFFSPFFIFTMHIVPISHLLYVTFSPPISSWPSYLLTYLYVRACSAALPLLPGLIIVLRKLPFSIRYPWQRILPWRAVCLCWSGAPSIPLLASLFLSLSPTRSSLFPFPLHYSLLHLYPHPLLYCLQSTFSTSALRFSLCRALLHLLPHPHILSAFLVLAFLLCELSLHACSAPPPHVSFTHLPHWLLLLRFIELFGTDSFIVRVTVFVCSCLSSHAELWSLLK